MPGSDLPEAQSAEVVFSLLDLGQVLDSYRGAVGNPRGQAGLGRFVPDGDVQNLGDDPHVSFRKPDLYHWTADPVLRRGHHARTVVSDIVGVRAVDHPLDGFLVGQFRELGVKLGLTEVAPLGRVGHVTFPLHLVGVDDAVREPEPRGKTNGLFQLSFCQGRRDGGDCQGLWPEHPVSRDGDQGTIDTPGESHGHRAHLLKDLFQGQ